MDAIKLKSLPCDGQMSAADPNTVVEFEEERSAKDTHCSRIRRQRRQSSGDLRPRHDGKSCAHFLCQVAG